MAEKQPEKATDSQPAGLLRLAALAFGPGRTLTICLAVLAGFGALATGAWLHVRPSVLQSSQYAVTADQIIITPPPAWFPAARAKSLPADALRLASPADRPLTSLDDDLAERVTTAFGLIPWVAKARVTKKAPARIMVDIVYRCPVCVVEVPGDLLPVDEKGILLPAEDFSLLEKQAFPCLSGIETRPTRPAGQVWEDTHVLEGAAIASALSSQWSRLKLYRIRPSAGNHYELVTRANSRILWGVAPQISQPGEPSTEDKVGRLVRYASEHGGLDGAGGPQQYDVRTLPSAM